MYNNTDINTYTNLSDNMSYSASNSSSVPAYSHFKYDTRYGVYCYNIFPWFTTDVKGF